jgi:glutathione S-transferase
MPLPMLWHIPLSHYSEKARWALDFKGIPHFRRVLGTDYLYQAWRATGQGKLPILFLDERPIHDSTAIIAALEQYQPAPPLYPSDPAQRERALALEDHFDQKLGPSVRASLVTPLFLNDPVLAVRIITTGFSPKAFDAMRPFLKVFPTYYRMRHKIRTTRLDQDRVEVLESLDRISAELQPSGYLVGDRFTVADLTASALLGAFLEPPEIQYPIQVKLPDYIREWQAQLSAHPAAKWVRGIYQKHRGTSAEIPRGH